MNSDALRHTVVYTHGGGRLGNQIIRWAHWLAWAWDHSAQVEVINVAFWPYAAQFEGSRHHPGCVEPGHRITADIMSCARSVLPVTSSRRIEGRIYPWSHRIACLSRGVKSIALDDIHGESIDLDGAAFIERIRDQRVTMCSGWKIAGWTRFKNHQARLRAYFQPAVERLARAQRILAELRSISDVVVGVLIRQTDYRQWNEGRFSFATEDYAVWMRQLVELYSGRQVAFLLACDEKQDASHFAGLLFRFASGAVNAGGNAFDSFVELSLCDAILGPPSTFAATAAFIADRPLWPVTDRGRRLHPDDVIKDSLMDAAQHPIYSLAVK